MAELKATTSGAMPCAHMRSNRLSAACAPSGSRAKMDMRRVYRWQSAVVYSGRPSSQSKAASAASGRRSRPNQDSSLHRLHPLVRAVPKVLWVLLVRCELQQIATCKIHSP